MLLAVGCGGCSGDDNAFESGDASLHDGPSEDAFGLSSPPPAAASSSVEDESAETGGDDPFATVDGGSSENAGAFDSFSNQPVEVKEEEAAALKSDQHTTKMGADTRVQRWAASQRQRWLTCVCLSFSSVLRAVIIFFFGSGPLLPLYCHLSFPVTITAHSTLLLLW